MSNHLKRLSDIFGSFVSKDFKRKRLQVRNLGNKNQVLESLLHIKAYMEYM